MEWSIPLQSLDIAKLRIEQPIRSGKYLIPLRYSDGALHFSSLTVLLPPLPVKSYDSSTGRLVFSLGTNQAAYSKLQGLQDHLFQLVQQGQRTWFPSERPWTAEELRAGFQPFIEHNGLHLYCPSSVPSAPNDIHVFSKGAWSKGASGSTLFTVGTQFRLVLRLQGLSLHQNPVSGGWTGKFRVQHRILGVLGV